MSLSHQNESSLNLIFCVMFVQHVFCVYNGSRIEYFADDFQFQKSIDRSCIVTLKMFHPAPPCAGLDEEGLYRKPGVLSKATKLVKECIEKGKTHSMNMTDEFEWDTKTLASAVKMYLNKQLGEPLFTFVMHHQFIDAASELILASALCIWQCQSLCGNDGVPRDRSLAPLCVSGNDIQFLTEPLLVN